jgi:hypothetical protein
MLVCYSASQRREQETVPCASLGTRILATEAVLSAITVFSIQSVLHVSDCCVFVNTTHNLVKKINK